MVVIRPVHIDHVICTRLHMIGWDEYFIQIYHTSGTHGVFAQINTQINYSLLTAQHYRPGVDNKALKEAHWVGLPESWLNYFFIKYGMHLL